MKKLQWQQSLLAIAVSSAAMSAMAVNLGNYDVSSGATELSGIVSDVTLSGSFTSIMGQPNFILGSSLVADSFTNNATIQVYTDGARPLALVDSEIHGAVTNAGQLKTNGAHSIGMSLEGTLVDDSVKNTGTINAVGRVFSTTGSQATGLDLNNSGIGVNLENSGQIYASGFGAIGVGFHGNQENTIAGAVVNTGSVSAVGDDAFAVSIDQAKINGGISNSSLIGATGIGATGVSVTNSKLREINNSGYITARGEDTSVDPTTTALYLANVQGLDSEGHPTALSVNNTKSIDGSGIGIKIDDHDSVVVIKNSGQGSITGQTAAIKGNGHTTLNMSGGTINGDLLGLDQVNVVSVGRFTGSNIEASTMSLQQGSTAYLNVAGTKISGNLSVAGGAKLDLQLSDETVPADPYLEVGGNANFAAESSVTVSSKANAFNPSNTGVEYTLLKAGSLTDGGLKVASNSYLLDVKSYAVDGTTIKAVVAAKSDDDIGDIEDPDGGSEGGNNGGDAGSGNGGSDTGSEGSSGGDLAQNGATGALLALKNSILGQLDTSDPIYQALANASTREEVARIAQQLTPEVNGGGSRAAVTGQNIVSNAISNRVSGLRSGMSSGEAFKDVGVWVQALSSNGNQDRRSGVEGFESNSAGIAVGVDGKINDQTTVGVAYSYMNSNVTSDSGDKTEVQGSAFTLYGSYEMGNWFADGSLSTGVNDNDSKRYIVGTQAKGSYDSDVLSASLLGGYDFRFDNLVVEPRVGARYTNVKIDSYREHGSSAALSIGAQRFEVGEFGAGVRVAGDFPIGMGNLEPEATLMAWHDVIGDKVSSTSTYVLGGNPFVTTGASPVRDSYEATVGATYKIGAVTVGASYGYQTKTDFDGQTVSGRVRYDF